MLKRLIKKAVPGTLWQNPVVWMGLRALNPLDYAVRITKGLSHLPPYSTRVRSNGLTRQFGGDRFDHYGRVLADLLQRHAALVRTSDVLEIGCGCGRTALALAGVLDHGCYTGIDIERVSLESCMKNRLLMEKGFRFDLLDVQNNEYNPQGKFKADEYVFPYGDGRFDSIFLVSVFTHMLTRDVKNYICEIGRMLKPNGVCMITTFLMDLGKENPRLSFPYSQDDHHYYNRHMPEAAIGYHQEFFVREFAGQKMDLLTGPLWGSWRARPDVESSTGFPQDVLFFSKRSR